ncbi:MAG: ATP-dependent metallopeptidase FtsH/Yme1/Tma family protein, partial [Desulfatirhabdiaceae bacterium]|nr:ATP-dependent metallopeptidase FtsH/Yme1/Tma family protein [Desulfatirhabdiaceae bacterium]
MNPLQKNIALWLVISLVFVMIYHLFNQPKTAQMDIVYSDFLSYVDKSQVTEVDASDGYSGRDKHLRGAKNGSIAANAQ